MKNHKYSVVVQNMTAIVYNNWTGANRCWDVRNFIYGQSFYDPKTDRYPNYVHADVWRLHEISQYHFRKAGVK